MTKTLITIDWDFFVPEDPMWDLGHNESLLFLNAIWATRMELFNKIKTNGEELEFWPWLWKQVGTSVESLYASESHVFAYAIAQEVDQIILFDAHHDAWEVENSNQVACHNWVRAWLKQNPQGKVIWVHPDNEYCDDCLPEDVRTRIERMPYSKSYTRLPTHIGTSTLHVCRSGCWTPPWLDEAFITFLAGAEVRFGGEAILMQGGKWNPMVPRWTPDEAAAYAQNWKRMFEQIMSKNRQSH